MLYPSIYIYIYLDTDILLIGSMGMVYLLALILHLDDVHKPYTWICERP